MTTWIELMGRHAAAQMLTLSGRMRVNDPGKERDFTFSSGPGGRWRIESGGVLVYIGNPTGAAMPGPDGSMQQVDVHTPRLGIFDPPQILGLKSLLLSGMSRTMSPTSSPDRIEFGGRAAWSTPLANAAGSGPAIEVVIDDESGVLVGLRPSAGGWAFEVTQLTVHTDFDEELFDWQRVAQPVPQRDRSPAAIHAERLAIITAIIDALERRAEVLDVVTKSANTVAARMSVAKLLGINEIQATAVLDMQMRRLSVEERARIRDEFDALTREAPGSEPR